MKRDVLADAVDVFRDDGVVNKLALLIYLRREATAKRHFFIERVEVDLVLIDVALADQARVFVFAKVAFNGSSRRLRDGLRLVFIVFGIFLLIRQQRRRHADQHRQQQNSDAL